MQDMKKLLMLWVLLTVGISAAAADEVTIEGLKYSEVKVTDFDGKRITFTLPDGRSLSKSAEQITSVTISNDRILNKAERLLGEKKFDEAIAQYKLALRRGNLQWQKRLIEFRLASAEKQKTGEDTPKPALTPKPTSTPEPAPTPKPTPTAKPAPTTKPAPSTKPAEDGAGLSEKCRAVLTSADAFADILEVAPTPPDDFRRDRRQWSRMTTLQKEELEDNWQEKHDSWRADLESLYGKEVTWVVLLEDVSRTEDRSGYIIIGRWQLDERNADKGQINLKRFSIRAELSKSAGSDVGRIHKDDQIELKGTIDKYRVVTRGDPDWSDRILSERRVRLDLGPFRQLQPIVPEAPKRRTVDFSVFRPNRVPFWVSLSGANVRLVKSAEEISREREQKEQEKKDRRDRERQERRDRDRRDRDDRVRDRDDRIRDQDREDRERDRNRDRRDRRDRDRERDRERRDRLYRERDRERR